ncbi:MAG: hypothetical protein L0Z53_17415 [Acidobacteriales bacterium]|nr:hypothetical protein [Terriglobales bacterium]
MKNPVKAGAIALSQSPYRLIAAYTVGRPSSNDRAISVIGVPVLCSRLTALVSVNQFPDGDRGGNEIPLARGRNLHSLWDNLLGRQHYLRDVARTVAELSDREKYGDVWGTAAKETDVRKWVDESHELAESVVYSDAILNAVR